jgi:hypothetical protein
MASLRQLLDARAPVPQRRVHAGQGQAGDGANRRGVGVKEQVLPDRLDVQRVAPEQARRQVVMQQRHDRRAPGTNGVRVARGLNAVAAAQCQQNGFLRHEGLDGVGAHHFGRQVDLPQADGVDGQRCCYVNAGAVVWLWG